MEETCKFELVKFKFMSLAPLKLNCVEIYSDENENLRK